MAKDFNSISAFVGKSVIVNMVKRGTEEITGTVESVKDGIVTLTQVSRGSTYTYRIPATEIVYTKSDKKAVLKEGVEVTIERSINKIVKFKGDIVGADANGIVLDRGEVRGSLVKSYIPFVKIDSLDYREQTEEGKARSAKAAARMKKAKGSEKSEKSEKKAKKSDKADKKAKKSKK